MGDNRNKPKGTGLRSAQGKTAGSAGQLLTGPKWRNPLLYIHVGGFPVWSWALAMYANHANEVWLAIELGVSDEELMDVWLDHAHGYSQAVKQRLYTLENPDLVTGYQAQVASLRLAMDEAEAGLEQNQLKRLYVEAGIDLSKIHLFLNRADALGISGLHSLDLKLLDKRGVCLPTLKKPHGRYIPWRSLAREYLSVPDNYPDTLDDWAFTLCRSGISLTRIARSLGCTRPSVSQRFSKKLRRLTNHPLELREGLVVMPFASWHWPAGEIVVTDFQGSLEEWVIECYKIGYSPAEVASVLGINRAALTIKVPFHLKDQSRENFRTVDSLWDRRLHGRDMTLGEGVIQNRLKGNSAKAIAQKYERFSVTENEIELYLADHALELILAKVEVHRKELEKALGEAKALGWEGDEPKN